jgi:hypothetical protein
VEGKLAKDPENIGLATDLADLLRIDSRVKTERRVRLGRQNEANGTDLVDYAPDGVTEPAEIHGQPCRLVVTGSRGWGHAYFAVDKGFKWAPTMDVQVEIDYWADSAGSFQIQYDSQDDRYNRSHGSVPLDGSRGWKTVRSPVRELSERRGGFPHLGLHHRPFLSQTGIRQAPAPRRGR